MTTKPPEITSLLQERQMRNGEKNPRICQRPQVSFGNLSQKLPEITYVSNFYLHPFGWDRSHGLYLLQGSVGGKQFELGT